MEDLTEKEIDAASQIANAVNSGGNQADAVRQLMAQNPELISGLMAKLGGMEGMSSDYLEGLPKVVKKRVKALKQLQAKAVELEVAYQREIQKLDRIFAPKFGEIYTKRASIVQGAYEPTEEESVWDDDEEEDEDKVEEVADEEEEDEDAVGIPDFWLGCLNNNPITDQLVQEHDIEILRHLINIEMEYSGEDSQEDFFVLTFTFEENEFFKNKTLTKTYYVDVGADEEELMYKGPSYRKSTGTTIDWHKGKNPTVKTVTKKQRKKGGSGAGKTRTVVREIPQDSFFRFFTPPPPLPEDEDDVEDTEELAALHAAHYEDFQLADAFKESIIPNSVLWFTGEALDYEDDEGDDDNDGDSSDDDFDPSSVKSLGEMLPDDDDDEDADPNYKPPDQAPECKQS